jgi:hypothetical protein
VRGAAPKAEDMVVLGSSLRKSRELDAEQWAEPDNWQMTGTDGCGASVVYCSSVSGAKAYNSSDLGLTNND